MPGSTPIALVAAAVLLAFPAAASAQEPAPAPAPEVGAQAPEFEGIGSTRYGALATPVSLAHYRGKTVVLAFFPRARTKG